jgi:predicted DCC family thiol-disulfide oxidoreductase YuxK
MNNKLLIYDDNCPLCSCYSSWFVRCGLLPTNGRTAFSALDSSLMQKIDFAKSKNEIPLLDTATGKVLYGIDSLLELLGQKCSLIKSTGNLPVINWLLRKLYKFISLNRKVIVAQKCGNGSIDCSPDMNFTYRILFMAVFLLVNTLLLFPLHHHLFIHFPSYQLTIPALQTAHFILVGINCLIATSLSRQKAIEFLGQVNMLALLAVLLLLPLAVLINLLPDNQIIHFAYVSFLSILLFKEYIRRIYYAGILEKHPWIVAINLTCIVGFVVYLLT